MDENVLTLDYVDVKIGNEERKDIYTWRANRWIFEKHGFTGDKERGYGAGNPWDNQVQFKDELITKTFPEGSGFEATYKFVLDKDAPKNLSIVIERPDLYEIYCNDKLIREPGTVSPDWWLDRAFGKIDLSKAVKPGENTVKVVAKRMTIYHELEPAYLLGDFSLQPSNKGFIVGAPQPLVLKQEAAAPEEQHSDEIEGVSWLSAGVGFRADRPVQDRSPSLTFEFDKEYPVVALKVWNYCERNLQSRGAKSVEITGLGKVDIPFGTGDATTIPFPVPTPLKKVDFKIFSNHAGTTYPIPDDAQPHDSGFVGLAEVQFLVKEGDKLVSIKNVSAKASSELTAANHDRRAKYLVDGSGLGRGPSAPQGWHRQGMPFYVGKVEYARSFEVAKVEGTYSVRLPDSPTGWYGTTARILVNGNDAGYVVSAPWSVDVTKFVKQGKNEVSVQVYGTPKNLLGPHHMGKMRGQAWPNAFWQAPENQPSGHAYDVIGCGMFEPFELIHVAP